MDLQKLAIWWSSRGGWQVSMALLVRGRPWRAMKRTSANGPSLQAWQAFSQSEQPSVEALLVALPCLLPSHAVQGLWMMQEGGDLLPKISIWGYGTHIFHFPGPPRASEQHGKGVCSPLPLRRNGQAWSKAFHLPMLPRASTKGNSQARSNTSFLSLSAIIFLGWQVAGRGKGASQCPSKVCTLGVCLS